MASDDPTGGERAVPLSIPAAQANYLRKELAGFKAGLETDLANRPDDPAAERWRSDAAAYRRLLAGLEAGVVVPDADMRRLVREWAEANDREAKYERVVFEHEALQGLRSQLEGRRQ
jgi:hypothetical protein